MRRATTECTFSTSELPKVVRAWCALHIFTSKCASRHNGVHFFNISTSKSGPTMVCFAHFHFEMCFAPQQRALFRHLNFQKWSTMVCFAHFHFEMCFARQRRALFRHLNFQKWSEHGVLCTFSLRNVLRATTACNFSSLIWPAGSAPAALASLLFDPPEPQIIGKTQCFTTFLPFRASASSFFYCLFPTLLFICPYCRKSKLPSMKHCSASMLTRGSDVIVVSICPTFFAPCCNWPKFGCRGSLVLMALLTKTPVMTFNT